MVTRKEIHDDIKVIAELRHDLFRLAIWDTTKRIETMETVIEKQDDLISQIVGVLFTE